MDYLGDRTGSCSETCVRRDVGGNEESSIKEEAVDVEDEIPEAITFPSIKTEHEVKGSGCV